jgi:CRISPR-associated endonuclease Cas1
MHTLYVTEPGSHLRVHNQQLIVFNADGVGYLIHLNQTHNIILVGYSQESDPALSIIHSRGIPLLLLQSNGTYLARLETESRRRIKYLAKQHQCARNPEFTRTMAETMVRTNLHHQHRLLQTLNSTQTQKTIQTASDAIARLIDNLPLVDSMEMLRRYQNIATHLYSQALTHRFTLDRICLFHQPTPRPTPNTTRHCPIHSFPQTTTTRKPLATHPINRLLRFGHILLNQHIYALLQSLGLHSHLGNLHIHHDHHPALVADFMAEFRVILVDTLVVKLLELQLFTDTDFTPANSRGGIYLTPQAIQKFITYWQKQLQDETPSCHSPMETYQQRLESQIRQYISCLLGDCDAYLPFL